MFVYSQFNGNISQWNVFGVEDMSDMFVYSQFTGDVSGWKVADDVICAGMFTGSLLEMNGQIPEWYKVMEKKWREDGIFDVVQEEDFNTKDGEDVDNLPF